MASPICTNCLARLRLSKSPLAALASPAASNLFHSSARRQNVVKKKTVAVAGARAPKLRESRSARIVRKRKDRPKPPSIGQRAMERRRIVLSNTNALEVADLEQLTIENMSDGAKIGQVLALDGPLLDQLREAKAFKTTQNWNLFRSPSTLQRRESVQMGAAVQAVNQAFQEGQPAKTYHSLVVGDRASGKSVHLLQAMSMAYLNKWVVVNVPDGQEYVNNQSPYAPMPHDGDVNSAVMYTQPQLAADLLTRLAHSNGSVLATLTPVHEHDKTLPEKSIKTLQDLALLGAKDRTLAIRAWDAVWKELTVLPRGKTATRPPILLAIDGVNFWMGKTKYRSTSYDPIHAHQFTLINQFLELLFAQKPGSLPFGGMVVACTTKSNHPATPAFELLVRQMMAVQDGVQVTDPRFPHGDPYSQTPDDRVAGLFTPELQTQVTELKGLSRPESRGLLEYFAKSGIFKSAVDDSAVSEKWTMSGGGIIGQLCKIGAFERTGMFAVGPKEGTKARV